MKKLALLMITVLILSISLSACGGKKADEAVNTASVAPAATAVATVAPEATKAPESNKPASIKFFSNNPDRKAGQGYAEQLLIDQYMKENPHIKITAETLSPDPQFQDKLKIYNATNDLPEMTMMWGGARYLSPLVKNEALVTFTKEDFAGQGFIDAAFAPFTLDGKIYAIPKNTDFLVLYVNKKLLADNGLEPPKTESDLFKITETLKAKNIVPIALDGRDAWPLGLLFDAVVARQSGSFEIYQKAMDRTGSFKDPAVISGAKKIQDMAKAGMFGTGFLNLDYGGARNLFGQGKAAMYLMGEWEMGISTDANFPEDVRNNMIVIPYPASDDGKGKTTDLLAWFGGGYSVSSKSENSAEAKKFAIWMFKKENWARTVWQNGITFPAQAYEEFNTGKETQVQKDLTSILSTATVFSGTSSQDKFSTATSKSYLDQITQLIALKSTPEKFAEEIDAIADKSFKELNP
ncbi:extracellular solute-binding protein [Paenibacillus psychroresistens]|uniref:Extracellular solute-binding protein n=1 Tax=Paenibacillus psychroresistens TaxID=1778678 RepID=A0A6B8RKL6_9BACL|nr:extracellular solute-binding protein [Paenibacillus psychroresistens]QGQ96377.1 extracellular solute-binding protein [Paenibacillus psychroresistens]